MGNAGCTRRVFYRVTLSIFMVSIALAGESPEQLIKAGHWKRAKPLVEGAYAANPKDAHVLFLMAKLKRVSGDLDQAHKLVEQSLALDSNNPDAHILLCDILGAEASKAGVFRRMSLGASLRREIENTVQRFPGNVDAHWGMMEYYLEAPGIAGGSKDKARAQQAEIARLSPPYGFLAQGQIVRHQDKNADVEELYRKAYETDPQNFDVGFSYCNYELGRNHWDVAEKCGLHLVTLDRSRIAGYSILAIAYASEKKWKDLDTLLPEAEKNVPDDYSPYFLAGRTLADSGADNARGERYLHHYLEQEPELNGPKPSRAHWRLGQLLEKEGRKSDAIAEYRIATQMEPQFEPAQKDLKRLQ